MLSAWVIGHGSIWEQTAINSCMQPAGLALGRTYCMPQCQLLKKIAEEKMLPNVCELLHFQSSICTWETTRHNIMYLGTGIC